MTVFCQVPPPPDYSGVCANASLELLYEFDTGCEDNDCMVFRYWKLTTCEGEVISGVQKITVTCNITGESLTTSDEGMNRDSTVVPENNSISSRPLQGLEVTSIDRDKTEAGYLKLYPNPAGNYITLTLEDQTPLNGEIIMNIYDQYGRLMKSGKLGTRVVDQQVRIDNLSGGMYFIELTGDDNRRWIKSFIKLD